MKRRIKVDKVHFFELRIKHLDDAGLVCQLYEMPPQNGSGKRQHSHLLSEIDENLLNYTGGVVNKILKNNNYNPSMLNPRRKAPFKLK